MRRDTLAYVVLSKDKSKMLLHCETVYLIQSSLHTGVRKVFFGQHR